jgi:hypothetical protein
MLFKQSNNGLNSNNVGSGFRQHANLYKILVELRQCETHIDYSGAVIFKNVQ